MIRDDAAPKHVIFLGSLYRLVKTIDNNNKSGQIISKITGVRFFFNSLTHPLSYSLINILWRIP